MQVTFIKADLYDVESQSNPEQTYVVDRAAGTCTCKGFQYRSQCKHLEAVRNQPQPTALAKAAAKAEGLTDEQLRMWAAQHNGEVAGCACLLEMARRLQRHDRGEATVTGSTGAADLRQDAGRPARAALSPVQPPVSAATDEFDVEGTRGVLANRRPPRVIPAGVECFLVGATEAERARALEIYSMKKPAGMTRRRRYACCEGERRCH